MRLKTLKESNILNLPENEEMILKFWNETKLLDKKLVQSSLTLLQNYDNLLPLKRLDTLRIASVSIGENSTDFKQMLSHYAPITFFTISIDLFIPYLKNSSIVIIVTPFSFAQSRSLGS